MSEPRKVSPGDVSLWEIGGVNYAENNLLKIIWEERKYLTEGKLLDEFMCCKKVLV